ncbi:MAG: hypothetical protein R2766_04240 [Saprospiraceae bacterium]
MTLECSDLAGFTPMDLMYSNGETGDCLIEGVVSPTSSGSLDACGSTIIYTWEYTDDCNRTITHEQTVTVEPRAEASFITPPGDMTLECPDI